MYVVPTAIIGKGPSVVTPCQLAHSYRRFEGSLCLYQAVLFGLLDVTDKDNRSLHVSPSTSLSASPRVTTLQ